MSRSIRILFNDAVYHVMNRGQDRRFIFQNNSDYRLFLKILKEGVCTYNVRILGYCLMGNHYHLLVQTPEANLSEFMKGIMSGYVLSYNKKYKKDGPLFKGRYAAKLVQEDRYLLRVLKYIHYNPLKAGMIMNLDDYPWSSHNHYLGKQKYDFIIDQMILYRLAFLKLDYSKFMKDPDDEFDEVYKKLKLKAVLGEEDYVNQLLEHRIYSERRVISKNKGMVLSENQRRFLMDICLKFLDCSYDDLVNLKKGVENVKKGALIILAKDRLNLTFQQIAQFLNYSNYRTVDTIYRRYKKRKNDYIENIVQNFREI